MDKYLDPETLIAIGTAGSKPVKVPVGDLGFVYVKRITAGERDEFDRALAASDRKPSRAHIIQLCTCDENGNPVFKKEQLDALDTLYSDLSEPIVETALNLNRLTVGAIDATQGE